MFSKELEALINASLEDGILEEYEKAAIVKRAKSEGVDLTELEIYINSIMQKRKREHDLAEDAKQEKIDQRKREAFGKVCPNCGKQVPPMTIKCECGYEFTKASTVSSVQRFQEKIEEVATRERNKGVHPRLAERQKMNEMLDTISLFPVPNTKEDIIEFLALAISNSKLKGGIFGTIGGRLKFVCVISAITVAITFILQRYIERDSDYLGHTILVLLDVAIIGTLMSCLGFQDVIRSNKIANAWRDKFQQVMIKARSMRGDAEFTQQLDYYESLLEE